MSVLACTYDTTGWDQIQAIRSRPLLRAVGTRDLRASPPKRLAGFGDGTQCPTPRVERFEGEQVPTPRAKRRRGSPCANRASLILRLPLCRSKRWDARPHCPDKLAGRPDRRDHRTREYRDGLHTLSRCSSPGQTGCGVLDRESLPLILTPNVLLTLSRPSRTEEPMPLAIIDCRSWPWGVNDLAASVYTTQHSKGTEKITYRL